MAFTNDDRDEIKVIVRETLLEDSDPIEDATEISDFEDGDVVPVVRTEGGVNTYKKAPASIFGGGGGEPAAYIKDAVKSNNGNTLILTKKDNSMVVFTPSGGGGSVVVVNDLTTGGTTNALSAEMGKVLNQKIEAISSGVKIVVSFTPSSVVYRGVSQTFTVSASVSKVTPTSLKIKDGSTVIANVSDAQTASAQRTETLNVGTKTYDAEAVVNGMTISDAGILYARYPIYYGFGANASAVATSSNRYDPTTTAVHTYTGTSSTNGVYFFILVPSDISGLTQFSMGGAPFVMDAETTTTISGVTYKVYKSGNAYNSGVQLSVEAK